MNRTLTCLLGLLLAAPLAAQHDHSERKSVEQHAAELLRMSADKAAAGHETEAADLAMKAAEMLRKQADIHRDRAHEAAREAEEVERHLQELEMSLKLQAVEEQHLNEELHEIIIVKDHDGNVIKIDGADLELGEHIMELQHLDKQLIELKSLGYISETPGEMEFQVMVSPDGPHGGLFEVHEEHGPHGEHEVFTWDSMYNHFTPMDGGDLHEELRAIHHELEELRHELHMLRSSMNGGQGRGMRGNRSMRGGMGGSWEQAWPHAEHGGGGEHQMSMGFFGDEGSLGDEDFDFDFELPEGVETHSQIKVIINGEVFEGDEARMKLKEMQGGEGHGRMKMKMMPAPPEPPKAPSRGNWRRSEGHEDL